VAGVVVTAKPRGSVIGDIPPESILDQTQVRAMGASDISELLERLAPQIGSARGRADEAAMVLLNGQRISSFRELRDLPPDAIDRLEILPEEVALRYGLRADRRVVNIVLREHFRSTNGLVAGEAATEGGRISGKADATRVIIEGGRRTAVSLRAEAASALTEDEREISPAPSEVTAGAARTLLGSQRRLRGTLTHHRRVGDVGISGDLEIGRSDDRSLIGLGGTGLEPLARRTVSDGVQAGFALSGGLGSWRWSTTGGVEASHSATETDGDMASDRERATSKAAAAHIDAMGNGELFRMPAGDAGATMRVRASTYRHEAARRGSGFESAAALSRRGNEASLAVELPLSRRGSGFAPLGNLALGAEARAEALSDAGFLGGFGANLSWSPVERLGLIASWTRDEGAPTVQQLGEPALESPGTRIFDFTAGRTVLVTALTGGAPDLDADRRNVAKLGANWKLLEGKALTLRAEYVRSRIANPISAFAGAAPALEAAFPERFVRNGAGELMRVDLRPVNFERARRDTLRVGLDYARTIKPAARPKQPPPQDRSAAGAPQPDLPDLPPDLEGSGAPPVRILFGPGDSGLGFSLTDTITLTDRVTIGDGQKLDYLDGDALDSTGGRPRHHIEARGGYFKDGRGVHMAAGWRSGTRVHTGAGETLRFSPLATVDVGLFATLDQRLRFVARHPWLSEVLVRFEVKNLFDAKPKVRDASGETPLGYRPHLFDPMGRTIGITFSKGGGGIGG
jgi:hypothetical protein